MADLNNVVNCPIPGSPRFEQDTAMAIARLRAALGPAGAPTFETLRLSGLTADLPVYGDADNVLQSLTIGTSLSFVAPTLNTIQDIRTTASPTFVTAKLTGLTDTYIPYHVNDTTGLANSNITYYSDDTTVTLADVGQFIVDARTTNNQATGAVYIKYTSPASKDESRALYISSFNSQTVGTGAENISAGEYIYSSNSQAITSGDFVYGGLHVATRKTGTSTTTDYLSSYGVFIDNLHLGTAVDGDSHIYGLRSVVVVGSATNTTSYAVYGAATGAGTNWAGYFDGNVNITGTVTVAALSGVNHNDLGSIQGGTTNEYYHLTSAQHTNLTGGTPSFTSLTLTGITTPLYAGPWTGAPDPISAHSNIYGDLFCGNDGVNVARCRFGSNYQRAFWQFNRYYDGSASKQIDTTRSSWSILLDGQYDRLRIQRSPAGSATLADRLRIDGATDTLRVFGGAVIGDGGTTNYLNISSTGDITFAGSAGFYPVRLSQSAQPTPDTGELIVWRDPDDNKTYLVYQDTDESTRKVELT